MNNEFNPSGLNLFVHEYIVPKIIKAIPGNKYQESKYILDLGCGNGELSQILTTDGKIVVGLDIYIANLKTAKKNSNDSTMFVLGDARYLPFKKEIFDCCFTVGVLHHILNFDWAVSEIHRILKRGGIYCGAEPNLFHPHLTTFINIGDILKIRGIMADERPISIPELRKSLIHNNFRVLWHAYLLGLKFIVQAFELALKPADTLKFYKVATNLDFLIPPKLRCSFLFIAEKF